MWGSQEIRVGVERAEEGHGDSSGGVDATTPPRAVTAHLGTVAALTHAPARTQPHCRHVSLCRLASVSALQRKQRITGLNIATYVIV